MALLPLLGLAALTGLIAAWLTVLLLVFPAGGKPGSRTLPLRGPVQGAADAMAVFSADHLLPSLPSPSRFFEILGPDRFRREIFRSLRSQTDSHVDEVMGRRNARAWDALSAYARTRVYTHVHRRLPFVVDNFVDHVHRELDDMLSPRALVQRYFADSPERAGQIFLSAFGADLRAGLPLAALGGALAGWLAMGIGAGSWQPAWAMGAAALTGSALVLASLSFPQRSLNFWPLRMQGILFHRRRRFTRLLAVRLANDALAWRVLSGEMLRGNQAGRIHLIMRREVSGILDTAVFKATLQLLIGPEGVVEIKRSALEKAMDVLTTTPVSAALQESYRMEVERTLLHAADAEDGDTYAQLWKKPMRDAWKILPPALALAGFGLGALAGFAVLR